MAYGGGTFTAHNKKLPGTYINTVARNRATATLSDRGVATVALALDWGRDSEMITVTATDFYKNSQKLFGYSYDAPQMFELRELFMNAVKANVYKLTSSDTGIATNAYATAKCSGARGNDLCVRCEGADGWYVSSTSGTEGALEIVADSATPTSTQIKLSDVTPTAEGYTPTTGGYTLYTVTKFAVSLYLVEPTGGEQILDKQTVATSADLIDNEWVTWNKENALAETGDAGTYLAGGVTATVTGAAYQDFLDLAESYACNIMTVGATDAVTLNLLKSYCIRMREEEGVKFQLVIYGKAASLAPDHEGIINVWTKPAAGKNNYTISYRSAGTVTTQTKSRDDSAWVWWVAGAQAGCAVNRSVGSKAYDGELELDVLTAKADLEESIESGHFDAHRNGDKILVLDDINSLTTTTDIKNSDFKLNQVIRVNDQNANDVAAVMGEKYYDRYNNNEATRRFIKADLTAILQQLAEIGAIEKPEGNDWSDVVIVEEIDSDRQAVEISEEYKVTVAINKSYVTVNVI